MDDRRVAVTGVGVVSPFGVGVGPFWSGLCEGRSATRPLTWPGVAELPTRFAAPVALSDLQLEELIENKKATKTMSRPARLATIAAAEAVRGAGLADADYDPFRVGTCLGTGGLGLFDTEYVHKSFDVLLSCVEVGDGGRPAVDLTRLWRRTLEGVHPLTPLRALPNMATAHLAIQWNARGESRTVTTACTSGTQALGEAFEMIRRGTCDAVIAGGSDAMVHPNGVVSFSALGVLSRNNDEYATAARPFDRRRDGFVLGEGAAVFTLELMDRARARGADILGEITGYAATCDAFRLTDEPPGAWGSIEAMRGALRSAGIAGSEVDYLNAHGTGTPMNDRTETFAIKTVFGDAARSLPVSSTKSMIGHLVAAAGAVEFAACVLAMQNRVIPPTINYVEPDPACDLDYVPNVARDARLRTVVSNSFGFGGQNACIVLKAVQGVSP